MVSFCVLYILLSIAQQHSQLAPGLFGASVESSGERERENGFPFAFSDRNKRLHGLRVYFNYAVPSSAHNLALQLNSDLSLSREYIGKVNAPE